MVAEGTWWYRILSGWTAQKAGRLHVWLAPALASLAWINRAPTALQPAWCVREETRQHACCYLLLYSCHGLKRGDGATAWGGDVVTIAVFLSEESPKWESDGSCYSLWYLKEVCVRVPGWILINWTSAPRVTGWRLSVKYHPAAAPVPCNWWKKAPSEGGKNNAQYNGAGVLSRQLFFFFTWQMACS